MYKLNITLTEEQRSLINDALYFYSEMFSTDPIDADKVLNAVEELEDLIDQHCEVIE